MRWPLLIASALLAAWVLWLAPLGHYSADAGVKLIQAHDLWESGMRSRVVHSEPPEVPVDRYRRIGNEFEWKVNGEWQGIYSIVFAAATAPLLAAGGLRGGYLVPLLGGILCIAGVWLALRRTGARLPTLWIACLFTGLLTPVLFYAGQFFEHTPATGLCALGLALLLPPREGAPGRERPLLAGALIAAAATVRPEAYCAIATTGLALVALPGPLATRVRRGGFYLAGVLPVLGAYWWLNHVSAGTWDPLVTINSKRHAATAGTALRMLWGELQRGPNASFLVPLAIALAVGLVPPGLKTGWRRPALHGGTALVVAVTAWSAYAGANGRIVVGLFAVTPIAAYGLVAGPWAPETRLHWIFSLLFVPLVVALESSGVGGGLQLGARLLLPALPALIFLAARAVEDDVLAAAEQPRPALARGIAAASAAALVLLSIAADVKGTRQALGIARAGEEAWRVAAAQPGKIIIAKLEWHAGVLTPAMLQGKDVVISRDADDRRLFTLLASGGIDAFVYTGNKPVKMVVPTDDGPAELEGTIQRTLPRELKALTLQDVRVRRDLNPN